MQSSLHEVRPRLHLVQSSLHEVRPRLHLAQSSLHELRLRLHLAQSSLHEVRPRLHLVQSSLHELRLRLHLVQSSLHEVTEAPVREMRPLTAQQAPSVYPSATLMSVKERLIFLSTRTRLVTRRCQAHSRELQVRHCLQLALDLPMTMFGTSSLQATRILT